MSIARCFNVEDFRKLARTKLPRPIFDYIDGGADDEITLRRNTEAFARIALRQLIAVDTASVDPSTTLFGRKIAWPLLLSPTGLTRMFHNDAEAAVGRAAAKHGLPYALSTMGTTRIEDFAALGDAPSLFQIYIFRDRSLTREWVDRCKAAKIDGLILTMDTPVAGNRERDRVNGLSLPPKLTFKSFMQFAIHPGWSLPALTGSKFDFANVSHKGDILAERQMSLFEYINRQFDRTLTWKDVEWLAQNWDGPLAVKGVLSAEDAVRAHEYGATAVMLSNHGGRQLDGAIAPVEAIAPVADAVKGKVEIICDGGVRRGSDVAKALALGADACSMGRPYLYALAAGGEAGVDRALTLLRDEFERTLILMGEPRARSLTRAHLA